MPGRLFLIHWHAAEAEALAAPLRAGGWQVDAEAADGGLAARRIREQPPDAVLISLTRLPSHGRETAAALRSTRATRNVPVIFVDGREEAVEKARAAVSDARHVTSAELPGALARLARPAAP